MYGESHPWNYRILMKAGPGYSPGPSGACCMYVPYVCVRVECCRVWIDPVEGYLVLWSSLSLPHEAVEDG